MIDPNSSFSWSGPLQSYPCRGYMVRRVYLALALAWPMGLGLANGMVADIKREGV